MVAESKAPLATYSHKFVPQRLTAGKKIVIKLSAPSPKDKSKVLKLVSKIQGVDSMRITSDGKDLLEVIGGFDPVQVVSSLRKKGFPSVQIISVGPAKDAEQKSTRGTAQGKSKSAPEKTIEYPKYLGTEGVEWKLHAISQVGLVVC